MEISSPVQRFFSQLFSQQPVLIHVRAVASFNQSDNACVLALNKTVSGAVTMTGNANVGLNGCSVMSDSLADESLVLGGTSKLSAPCVRSVGGVDNSANLTLTKCSTPTSYAPYLPDPYADLVPPAITGPCLHVPHNADPVTLSPGRYCNGMDLSGNVTLQPGTYVVDSGTFRVNANADVYGNGVTIYLANDAGTMFNGTARIRLSAPTSGLYKGILFYGDRNNAPDTQKFNGTADSTLTGVLYMPTQDVQMLGDFSGSGGCTQIVASTFTLSGSTAFASDCSSAGIDQIALASQVQLVE